MKKYLYYITPFILIPAIGLLCDYLDNINLIHMSSYIVGLVLAFISVVIGNLSPTNRSFDYIMTIIMPLSFFCLMFLGGFLDRDCSGKSDFSLTDAVDTAFQSWCLIFYCIMAVMTFFASFKPMRVAKRLKTQKS